tara:strand:+ start:3264 stop:3908 length:645 start_codon:yes stop_codon:yes gene_type:complete
MFLTLIEKFLDLYLRTLSMHSDKRLGFFLEPSSEIYDLITKKKELFKLTGLNQNFVEDTPHCTLFHGYFNNPHFIIEEFNNLKITKVDKFKIKETLVFENDHLTGYDTLAYKIDNNSSLNKVQVELIKKFKPDNPFKFENLESKYFDSLKKFNYPYVGELLIPHITVTNIELRNNKGLKKAFINENINLVGKFNSIFIGEIINGKLQKIIGRPL